MHKLMCVHASKLMALCPHAIFVYIFYDLPPGKCHLHFAYIYIFGHSNIQGESETEKQREQLARPQPCAVGQV